MTAKQQQFKDLHAQNAATIREYCRSQVDTWRQVPYWALMANGRGGWLGVYTDAYEHRVWSLGDSIGWLVRPNVDLDTGDLLYGRHPASDDIAAALVSSPELIDAERIVQRLKGKAQEPLKDYAVRMYQEQEVDEHHRSKAAELNLSPNGWQPRDYSAYFVSPSQQLNQLAAWHEWYDLKLSGKAIKQLAACAPKVTWMEAGKVWVLVPYGLPLLQLCQTLWQITAARRNVNPYFSGLHVDGIQPIPSTPVPTSPRWELIDFANLNGSVRKRNIAQPNSAHAGVLAAAAHFIEFPELLQGDRTFPSTVLMPGSVTGDRQEVPTLEIKAYYVDDNNHHQLSVSTQTPGSMTLGADPCYPIILDTRS